MANLIVVSFKDETTAIQALHKIKELNAFGDITLYEHMMIRKKAEDDFDIVNDRSDGTGWRTVTGMVLGGIVGSFAGPVGLIVGLYSGTLVGALLDVGRYDFEDHFIHKVSNKMEVGSIALIAEVGEDSSIFVDNYLASLDVEVIRTNAGVEMDSYIDEQIEDIEEDIEEEREKLKKASTDEKAKITTKIDELKAKRKKMMAELEAKRKLTIASIKERTETKINKLESKLEKFEDKTLDSIAEARAKRIKKKIARQQSKLNVLNRQLAEVLD